MKKKSKSAAMRAGSVAASMKPKSPAMDALRQAAMGRKRGKKG